MIAIVPYSQQWEQQHILFASKYWTKRRRREPEYIYWKFRGITKQPLSSFILAVEDGKVIGQLGLIPCKIEVGHTIYEAQWACDLMVDNEYRGKNVAALLYAFAHQQKPITLGSDPSPAASKSMKKNGYHSMQGSWKHLFPIKLGEITKLKGYDFKILNFLYNPYVLLFLLLGKIKTNHFKKIEITAYEELNYHKKNDDIVSVYRDAAFIKWRLNSFKDYYSGQEIFGQPTTEVFYCGYFSGTSYYITELNVKSTFELFAIISNVLQQYKRQGLKRIRFCCNQDTISKKLLFFGFIKFRTRTEVIYHSPDPAINEKMKDKKFYYTFMDSDENI